MNSHTTRNDYLVTVGVVCTGESLVRRRRFEVKEDVGEGDDDDGDNEESIKII